MRGGAARSLSAICLVFIGVAALATSLFVSPHPALAHGAGASRGVPLPAAARFARTTAPARPTDSRPGPFPFQTVPSPDGLIVLHYYYRLANYPATFFSMAQQALSAYIEPTLGYGLTSKVDIYVYNSRYDFLVGAQPDNPNITAAYAEFSRAAIYMPDYPGSDAFGTLAHELTHTALHEQLEVGHLQSDYRIYPNWLDEGLAASDEPNDSLDGSYLDGLLRQSLGSGYFLDIFRIFVWDYPSDVYTDDLCYAEARSFIKHLEATYGPARFHQFIAALKDGDTLSAAFVFGADLRTLQSQWVVSLGRPALGHRPPTLPAVPMPTPVPYTPGRLASVATRTTPFAVSGGEGWLLTAIILAAGATGVVLLGLGAGRLRARHLRKLFYARQTAIALALPPTIAPRLLASGPDAPSLPPAEHDPRPDKPRTLPSWLEQLALLLAVPFALGVGVLWALLDPSLSWLRAFLAASAAALGIVLGLGALAWRAWRGQRIVLSYVVTLVVLVAGALTSGYTGQQAAVAQGAAYESAGAYALAVRTLTDAGASRADLLQAQVAWADAAYTVGDYAAATQHYRAAIALAEAPAEAQGSRATLVTLTGEWGVRLVAAHLYDQAVRVYADEIASPSCDRACQTTLKDADGAAYLAWATNLIVTRRFDDALARLRELTRTLPNTSAAATAQHVLTSSGKGLAAAWAVGRAGDITAMNLLLEIFALQMHDPLQQALASESAQPVTGRLGPTYLYKSIIHIYVLAFANSSEAEAFLNDYRNDNSLFKVATATDANGHFTVWLPSSYTYVAVWEAPAQGGEDDYIYWSGNTFAVQPFTPLTLSYFLVA
jgi:tetratricopeptide (TPR) repeat protein